MHQRLVKARRMIPGASREGQPFAFLDEGLAANAMTDERLSAGHTFWPITLNFLIRSRENRNSPMKYWMHADSPLSVSLHFEASPPVSL